MEKSKLSLEEIKAKYGTNKPILVGCGPVVADFALLFLDTGEWTSYNVPDHDRMGYTFSSLNMMTFIGPYYVIDYFDETTKATGNCTCEKYSLFQSGCKCGAIVPYVQNY